MEAPILYHYSNTTFEFMCQSEAVRDQFDECWIIPTNTTTIKPGDPKDNFVNVFDENSKSWSLVEDCRGQIYFSKTDGSELEIKQIGAVSNELTDKKYPGQFYKWDNNDWILNELEKNEFIISSNKSQKNICFDKASAMIKMYEEAERDGDILPEEFELLKKWRSYQRAINRFTDLTQENVVWPEMPE